MILAPIFGQIFGKVGDRVVWLTLACHGGNGLAVKAVLLGDHLGAFVFGWHLILDFGNENLEGAVFGRWLADFRHSIHPI